MNTIRAHCIGWSLAGAIVLAGVGSQSLRPTEALRRPALALVGATVIDGTGGPPIPDVVVVVEGGRIVGVGPRARMNVPPGALQRDVAGLTILPGLIDSHVHLI